MGIWSDPERCRRPKTDEVYRGRRYDGTRRFWTLEDDRLLIKMRCGGIKPDMAAEVLGRGVQAISSRTSVLLKAGVIARKPGLRWEFSAAPDLEEMLAALHAGRRLRGTGKAWDLSGDEERVAELAQEGLSAGQIAVEMGGGRTEAAVRACLVRLRQAGEIPYAFRAWKGIDAEGEPYDHIRQLCEDFYAGFADEVIAKRLNRSAGAVIKKRHELGLKRNFQGFPTWA